MILFNDKSYTQTSVSIEDIQEELSDFYYIDETTEKGRILTQKIIKNAPYFDFVLDAEGNLIDITPIEKPFIPPTKEQINAQVVEKIREVYSVDDEFQMQRLGLQDLNNTEYQTYLTYVNDCIAWGDTEKQKYGYI